MFFYSIAARSTSRRREKQYKVQSYKNRGTVPNGGSSAGKANLDFAKQSLQQIDGMVDQNWTENSLRFSQDVLQRFFHVLLGV